MLGFINNVAQMIIMTRRCVNVTDMPPVLGKGCLLGLSSVVLLFVKTCLSIFPFDVWYKLCVLILQVPEVS